MKRLGLIDETEIDRVLAATKLFYIPENDGYGVTLSVSEGRRVWVIINDWLEVMIIGGPASFTETYVLPIRLLESGSIQAHLGSKTVELSAHNGSARFTGEQGFAELPLLDRVELFSKPTQDCTTTAIIRGYHLGYLISLGTAIPNGVEEQEVSERVPPISKLKFCSDSLEITSEFREIDAPRSHMNLKAEISGITGQVAVSRRSLRSITNLISQDDVGMMKISCDVKNGQNLLIESDHWKVIIRQRASGAGIYFDKIVQTLNANKYKHVIDDEGRICATIDGHSVELNLFDGRLPVIRCTIELVSGVDKTWALLREIDQQNEGRVCTKFFTRDDSVVACLDIVCAPPINFIDELNSLVEDSKMLGACLAALGARGTQLDLFA